MNTQVAVNSLAISKNSDKSDFQKYNIEVTIEEIENRITSNKLRFGLTLLTNPKNVRISIEGTTEISGTESECAGALEKDENGIPHVLHLIYQDIFPTVFMTTKVVGAPCPAYRLSQISTQEIPKSETSSEDPATETEEVSQEQPVSSDEKKPEEMTVEELNHLSEKLDADYQNNPTPEIEAKIQQVSDLIQKQRQEQVVSGTSL